MGAIGQDLRYACRTLWRSPGFTLTAVAILAVGIGVNVAVFSLSNAVLFRGFPLVDGNDRIVYISSEHRCCVSYPDLRDWQAQAQSFEGIGAVADLKVTLRDTGGFPEKYTATLVTANTFQLVGQGPILGRDFTPADERPGAAAVVMLSYAFWERRYGADPALIGQAIRINGGLATVIGVMPPGFSFPQKQEMWAPLLPSPEREKREARDLWFAFGRLAGKASVETARSEMEAIGTRLAIAHPRTNRGSVPIVQNFHEFFIGPNAAATYGSLWGAVGFVLLIVCANLANLLLARSLGRSREVSVRLALGASRWRIVRQLLVESLLLSGLGGVFGLAIATLGISAYQFAEQSAGTAPWRVLDYSMDYRVFAYLTAISIATGLLFALAPISKLSELDINGALKESGRGASSGGRAGRLSSILVTAEVALAIVLLAGAGVMIRSFLNVYNAGIGVRTANILTALVVLPDARYPDEDAQASYFDRLLTNVSAIPGVRSAAIAGQLPTWGSQSHPYEIDGAPSAAAEELPRISTLVVSGNYFATLGAPLLSGRDFSGTDQGSGTPVAIVNQRFVDRYWPGDDPLGKQLRQSDGDPANSLVVIGVASDIVQNDATRQEVSPVIYVPYAQQPAGNMWIVARTSVSPASLGAELRHEVQALDSDLPVWLGPFTLAERLASNYRSRGVIGLLFLCFAAVALLVASTGLYAVIAHSVSRRGREFGIRMALGSTASEIGKLVLVQGMRPAVAGLLLGLAGSAVVNRLLGSELVDVAAFDPATLAVASTLLIVAAILGCSIPAHRATRVDPAVALRHE